MPDTNRPEIGTRSSKPSLESDRVKAEANIGRFGNVTVKFRLFHSLCYQRRWMFCGIFVKNLVNFFTNSNFLRAQINNTERELVDRFSNARDKSFARRANNGENSLSYKRKNKGSNWYKD